MFARVRFQAGDRFIAQGDSDTTVYLITAGLARVDRRGDEVGARFTPIYTFSDNPLHSEHDRYDSLAVMGPFFEGSRFNTSLWKVLREVLAGCA